VVSILYENKGKGFKNLTQEQREHLDFCISLVRGPAPTANLDYHKGDTNPQFGKQGTKRLDFADFCKAAPPALAAGGACPRGAS
jgi:hypothetical protein